MYPTIEAVKKTNTTVYNKGKERSIIIPTKLAKELKKYCKENDITTGIVFTGRSGKLIDKAHIWREMKMIAGKARVKKDRIHAHSFRHLFAKQFLSEHNNNIVYLADILGHGSLETTRIYTKKSSKELRDMLDRVK